MIAHELHRQIDAHPAAHQRIGWALPKHAAVLRREAAEVEKTVFRGAFGYANFLAVWTQQRAAHALQTQRQNVLEWSNPKDVAKGNLQRATGAAEGSTDSIDMEVFVP